MQLHRCTLLLTLHKLHNGLFIMTLRPKSIAQLVKAYASGHGKYDRSLRKGYLTEVMMMMLMMIEVMSNTSITFFQTKHKIILFVVLVPFSCIL